VIYEHMTQWMLVTLPGDSPGILCLCAYATWWVENYFDVVRTYQSKQRKHKHKKNIRTQLPLLNNTQSQILFYIRSSSYSCVQFELCVQIVHPHSKLLLLQEKQLQLRYNSDYASRISTRCWRILIISNKIEEAKFLNSTQRNERNLDKKIWRKVMFLLTIKMTNFFRTTVLE